MLNQINSCWFYGSTRVFMEQLIERLESEYGMTEIEAQAVVETVGAYFRRNFGRYKQYFEWSEEREKEAYLVPGMVNPGLETSDFRHY